MISEVKAFVEEYGLIIVAVVVVAMLILVASRVSSNSKGKMYQLYNGFTEEATQIKVPDGGSTTPPAEGEGDGT